MKNKILLVSLLGTFLCGCNNVNTSSISISTSNSVESSVESVSSSSSTSEELQLGKANYFFLGSSVTYGFTTGGVSFVEMLPSQINCECFKSAISGTTLTYTDNKSYAKRVETAFDYDTKVDHFIVQLSTNDISQNKTFGYITDMDEVDNFDTKTVIGAMEYIISFIKSVWECDVSFYTNPYYNNARYEDLIDELYKLQEKWDIGIIDYYNYKDMEPLDSLTLSNYMSDSIHPNAQGYKWMSDYMSEYLRVNYEKNNPGYTIKKN